MPTAQWSWVGEPDSPDSSGWELVPDTLESLFYDFSFGSWVAVEGIDGFGMGYAKPPDAWTWQSMFGIPANSVITHVQCTHLVNQSITSDPDDQLTVTVGGVAILTRNPNGTLTDSSGSNYQLPAPLASGSSAGSTIRVQFDRGGTPTSNGIMVKQVTLVATYQAAGTGSAHVILGGGF